MTMIELRIDVAADSLDDGQAAAMRSVGCVSTAGSGQDANVQLSCEFDEDAEPDAWKPVLSKAIEVGLFPMRISKVFCASVEDAEEIWSAEPLIQERLAPYFSHLVSLSGCCTPIGRSGEPLGPPQVFHFSGFVISKDDQWYWITAGHVFAHPEEGIETHRQSGQISIDECWLIDSYNSHDSKTNGFPFNYWEYPSVCDYDDQQGIDLFALKLSDLHRKLLEANGVNPLSEAFWQPIEASEAEGFFMIGLPCELEGTTIEPCEDGYDIATKPMPVAIHCTLEVDTQSEHERAHRRFTARIHGDAGNIKGMSGGPIFGEVSGEPDYRVVALQSTWNRQTRVSFGCPIDEVIQRLPE